MADEQRREGRRVGPYVLGRRYEEVGPDLGRLYEARHVDTGKPVLIFLPGTRVRWRPRGEWAMRISCMTGPTAVRMEVDEAPEQARVTELADVLVLGTAAFQRTEDNPDLAGHLFARPSAPPPPITRLRRRLDWRMGALVSLVVVMNLGVWKLATWAASPEQQDLERDNRAPLKAAIAYPMPSKPFSDQASAPCVPDLGEVELNSGCWMELARRAPCIFASQAEHKGKCYLPVSKDRPRRPPTSVGP